MRALLLSLLIAICSVSFGQNTPVTSTSLFEGEPYLAVNPNNPMQLAAAWISVELGQGGVIRVGTSSDGGLNWGNYTYFPHEGAADGSADPSIMFDNNNNLFVCYIDYDKTNFTEGHIVIRKSTDAGLTWGSTVEAISITDCPNQYCIDRPWMQIDRSGGPNNGAIYVTSMNPDQPTLVVPPYHPYVAVSSDGGASFSTPRYLDSVNFWSGSTISQPMASPAIDSDGNFRAIYTSYETSQSPFARIILATSNDLCNSISHQNAYTVLIPGSSDPYAKKGFLLAADPAHSNHMAMFFIGEQTSGDGDIIFMETVDGNTWTTPIRLNQDPVGNGKLQDLVWASFNEQGDLGVCWRDRRNGATTGYQTETEIYMTIKHYGSSTFSTDAAISPQINHDVILEGKGNDFMNVQFVGNKLYSIWGDVRTGTLNIYLNVYEDGVGSTTTLVASENLLTVSPNPVVNEFEIEHYAFFNDLELIDLNGRKVLSIESPTVNVESLTSGVYFLNGFFQGTQVQTKIVIE